MKVLPRNQLWGDDWTRRICIVTGTDTKKLLCNVRLILEVLG